MATRKRRRERARSPWSVSGSSKDVGETQRCVFAVVGDRLATYPLLPHLLPLVALARRVEETLALGPRIGSTPRTSR